MERSISEEREIKKYRAPEPGTKEAEVYEQFKAAGIDVGIPVTEEGEHRLIFFGALPEDSEDSSSAD